MLNNLLLDNYEINYEPLALFYTLFNVVQHNTDIKGYWLDNKGKLYIDNIELITYGSIFLDRLQHDIKRLFNSGENCIAYKNVYNELLLVNPDNSYSILKNRIAWLEDKKPSKSYIKALLLQHNGLTIYRVDNGKYLLEIYS